MNYLSCELIENGLDFAPNRINLCCRTNPAVGGENIVLMKNYNGEPIDWDKFFELKNKYRSQLQEGKMIPECEGCLYLEKKDWSTDNYISTINLNNWVTCNLDCSYCNNVKYFRSVNFKSYNVLPIFKDMIKKNLLRPGGSITIAGGEPTIIKEFDELLNLMINFGLYNIRILSNGVKYSKSIEKGLKTGAVDILVSTDSGTRETYKEIKKVDVHNKVWKNIEKYIKHQKYPDLVKTKYIFIPGINTNTHEIDEWIKININSGVKMASVDFEISWFENNKNNIPKELYDLLDYLIDNAVSHGLKIDAMDRAAYLLKKENNHHKECTFRRKEI